MQGGDVLLYNDLKKYLQDKGVGFEVVTAASLGEESIKQLTYALFPFMWIAINDEHNRRGSALYPEFGVFYGRKILGHKLDIPEMVLLTV